jgi:outer membrane protein TolC
MLLASALSAQAPVRPLRLADALAEADRHAFANRQADAGADGDRARARLPLAGILPSVRLEGGWMRTTDPIGAFGTTLRQRRVSPAAFDPASLNDPAPSNNVAGGAVVEVPVFNADAWTGWRAATSAADASRAAAAWTATTTRAMVVRAFYGAVLAQQQVTTLEQAQGAADAAVRQVEAMVRQGLVTRADALQASVRAGDVASQLLSARNEAQNAAQQLAVLLGRRDATAITLPRELPTDDAVRALAAADTISVAVSAPERALRLREDVHAAQLGARAALADRRRAASALLPRLNGFARYDWNSPATLYAGKPNWTVGLMGSWSLLSAATDISNLAAAAARARGARASEEGARAQALADVDASTRAIRLALQRLTLAAQSAAQSREAHRLVEKRYAGGLATIAELLGAESSATGATLAHAAARFAVIDALALHRRAVGADPGAMAMLDTTGVNR